MVDLLIGLAVLVSFFSLMAFNPALCIVVAVLVFALILAWLLGNAIRGVMGW